MLAPSLWSPRAEAREKKLTQSIMFDAGPMSNHWAGCPVGAGISPFREKATCAGWVGSGTVGLAACGGSVGRQRQ